MSDTETNSKRLRDIWAAWGLSPQQAEATAQRDALAALETYLASGPTALVRCMQALLVDPESPGANKRPLFAPLWSAIQEKWAAAGTGKDDVRLLQAMLLAVTWPGEQAGKGLAPALLSPWMDMSGRREEERKSLEEWRRARANEDSSDDLLEQTHEYLWWGQARYCHSLRMPYRRIDDIHDTLWYAAWEAAKRAAGLPIEPSASYLQEVLHSLGIPITESQPVHVHVEQLRSRNLTLTESRPSLYKVVTQDALGLPIVRFCASPPIALDELTSLMAIPPETPLDYGSWAAWIFRELVLIHRWPEPPQ